MKKTIAVIAVITTLNCLGLPNASSESETECTYTKKYIRTWTVHVNDRLLGDREQLGDRVMELLDVKLYALSRVVPAEALEALYDVPIWLDVEAKQFPCCVYHPSADWLREHGFNPEMSESVHIANASNFLDWSLDQPAMILHEMAHAYHHRVLGHGHRGIQEAFEHAVERKSYENVLHYDGKTVRAYALENDQEYFAELTEAYFWTNDFYPFVRAEVLRHDPEMAAVLRKVWGESP